MRHPVGASSDRPVAHSKGDRNPLFNGITIFANSLTVPQHRTTSLTTGTKYSMTSSIAGGAALLVIKSRSVSGLTNGTGDSGRLGTRRLVTRNYRVHILHRSSFRDVIITRSIRNWRFVRTRTTSRLNLVLTLNIAITTVITRRQEESHVLVHDFNLF